MSSLSPVSEALSVIANFIVAFSAFAGAIAAFSGLYTWKKQGLWQQDNDLARAALLGLRRKHDALMFLRSPFVSVGEMMNALENSAKDSIEEQGWAAAIDKRFEKLRDANQNVFPILVEASAVWGEQIEEEFKKLDAIELKVRFAIEDVYRQDRAKQRVQDNNVATRKIAFSSSDDPISEEYRVVVEGLRRQFKQKLGRA